MASKSVVEPPTKAERDRCYSARDAYFQCVDNKNSEETCKPLRAAFEANCSTTWVRHFDRKHQLDKFKQEVEEAEWKRASPNDSKN